MRVIDHINNESCELCVRFGDKVPYEEVYVVKAVIKVQKVIKTNDIKMPWCCDIIFISQVKEFISKNENGKIELILIKTDENGKQCFGICSTKKPSPQLLCEIPVHYFEDLLKTEIV